MATKLFVSSVSSGLEEIRQQVGTFIEKAGHQPVLFEADAFAKNQSASMLTTCLRAVEQSHIYILIIGYEVGYVVPEQNKSVTHLELKKAIAANKTLYVFVEDYIKNIYFKEYLRIFRQLRTRESEDGSTEAPTFDEIIAKMGNLSVKREVLAILNDAYQVVPWIFGFHSSDDIIHVLKKELSATLEDHITLRNNRQLQSLDSVISASERFQLYNRFLDDFFPLIEEIKMVRYDDLLRKAQGSLKGGTIYFDEGAGIISELVKVGNSEGTSLYLYDGSGFFDLVARSGLANPRQIQIPQEDSDSYVTLAYGEALASAQPGDGKLSSSSVFYTDRLIYLCHVFGNYVLTVHFPIEEQSVDNAIFNERMDELYAGLLKIRANGDILNLVRFIL
ncbi:DUF4062 domain-containing protein [Paenibacillus mendelii]|uniref:DUF4062 domain-containing protein n=1 Tax=Paenibacillus mendelii TaxID=206163 RepID=A0ABV6JBT1_9BACL|nr:DUF4062 domain-containing protein [Paenibacillus mendelii]MCQ6562596.1 DUF4062 domain-containing protein [Paenibacillus mendelii]